MSDRRKTDHPDLFELAAYAEGSLDGKPQAAIRLHLTECALCSLEMKRLARFESIDEDQELMAEASWESAEAELATSHRASGFSGRKQSVSGNKNIFSWRWAVPAAAAAVLLVLFLPDVLESPERYSDQSSPLRGGEELVTEIFPLAPVGELAGPPEFFSWKQGKPFDSFTLRIFTPELEPVYEEAGITSRKRAVADSLLASLRPGKIYLWTVTGHSGVEEAAASPAAKFSIRENPPQK